MEKHIKMWQRTCLKVAMGAALITFAGDIGTANAQSPVINWQRCSGGTDRDIARCIKQTNDGSYIACGYTKSNDGDVTGYHGMKDAWVARISSTGSLIWQKTFGGSSDDEAASIIQTADGGYAFTGYAMSTDGDITKSTTGMPVWVVKLDASGNMQWEKFYGGTTSFYSQGYEIKQTTDGSYMIAADAGSNNGDVTGYHGGTDIWVFKIDGAGAVQWQKCVGGSGWDISNAMCLTPDGGCAIAAQTSSSDGDITGGHGDKDGLVVKMSSAGSIEWTKCYGGSKDDDLLAINTTSDGGFIVTGKTVSTDGDAVGRHGNPTIEYSDMWVLKLSGTGAVTWKKCIGGGEDEEGDAIQQTVDGGYIVAGQAWSEDDDLSGVFRHFSGGDAYVVKLDAGGAISWQKCVGGSNNEVAYSIQQTTDAGYILAGYTGSNNGDVSGFHGVANNLLADFWTVKLASFTASVADVWKVRYSAYPNPNNGRFTVKIDGYEGLHVEVVVTDVLGQVVYRVKGMAGKEIEIATDAPAGVYLLSVNNGTDKFTEKIIIQ